MATMQRLQTDISFVQQHPTDHWIIANLTISGMPWVTEITPVLYKGYELLILPAIDDLYPAVATHQTQRVEGEPLFTPAQAQIIICNFLSAVCWSSNEHIIIEGFSAGIPPFRYAGREFNVRTTDIHYFDEIPEVDNPREVLALALYREAMGVNNPAFQFLGYYKIINILHRSGNEQKKWINKNLEELEHAATKRLQKLKEQEEDIGKYLYELGRNAVAHANVNTWETVANPDNFADYKRLSKDMPLIKGLAARCIECEFGIQSPLTILKEHLYELRGFKNLFKQETLSKIMNGEKIKEFELPHIPKLSIRLRGKKTYNVLESLTAKIIEVEKRGILLSCSSLTNKVEVFLFLNFIEERLQSDFIGSSPLPAGFLGDDGTPEAAERIADFYEFRKWYLANGVLEVWATEYDTLLGRCDPFVPTNMYLNHEKANKEIENLRKTANDRRATMKE